VDLASRFTLLGSAVAGRTVAVSKSEIERSWSDGETIYLAGDGGDAVRDSLVVQAALLAVGSLDARIVARTAGRARIRHRYLTLEAVRAVQALGEAVPRHVTRRVAGVYEGPPAASPAESLERALSPREDVPEAPPWLGTIRPGKLLRNASRLGGDPAAQDPRAPGRQSSRPDLDEDEDHDRSRILELFQTPATSNVLGELLQKLLGVGRSPELHESAGGDELPVGGLRAGGTGHAGTLQGAAPEQVQVRFPIGHLYPEWDWRKRRYRAEWCAVAEYDPPPGDTDRIDVAQDPRLRRELARLGLAHERHRRQDEGDVLDMTPLIELVVDRAAGAVSDPRVYEQRRRTAHDLGALVLLDATGSTGVSDESRRMFDDQRDVAARLTAALDELGDRVAAYGFRSWGRNSVQYLRIKDFDGRYDHAAERRLAALEPGGFTRLGAAIRHGTHLLTTRAGTANTLLVVVGDGLPYDDGYEHRYAQEDCRRALQEAVLAGVGCACISVRTPTDVDVLRRVWGHVPYSALERPADLSRQVAPMFRRAMREASASRRRIGPAPDVTSETRLWRLLA